MAARKRLELLDQPERRCMYLGEIPIAIEAEPELRVIRVVMLIRPFDHGPARDYEAWLPVDLRRMRLLGLARGNRRLWYESARAESIVHSVHNGLAGLPWRWLPFTVPRWMLRLRGIWVGIPMHDPTSGIYRVTIHIEPRANYDAAYDHLIQAFQSRTDFEGQRTPRARGDGLSPRNRDLLEVIELPDWAREDPHSASASAARALLALFASRGKNRGPGRS